MCLAVIKGGGQSGAAPARPSLLEPIGAAQQLAPAAQRSAQTLSPISEIPSPDQAHMSTDTLDIAAQKPTSVVRPPTDSTHRPSAVSDSVAEVHTAGVDTLEHQQAGMPVPRPGWGKPPRFPGTSVTRHQKRNRSDTTCQVSGMHLFTHGCSCLDPLKFMTDVHAHQACISFQGCMLLG